MMNLRPARDTRATSALPGEGRALIDSAEEVLVVAARFFLTPFSLAGLAGPRSDQAMFDLQAGDSRSAPVRQSRGFGSNRW